MARQLSKKIGHIGNLDIDFIETEEGEIFVIDFNPRFGGGYPFTHLSGANYLKFIIDSSQDTGQVEVPVFEKSITAYKGLSLFLKEDNE